MTLNGWLPCTGVKQGYFNKEQFLEWLANELLPTLQRMYRGKSLVIVLNNCSMHVDLKIEQMIEAADYFIHYLSSYLSDFNSIELTFSVLKI